MYISQDWGNVRIVHDGSPFEVAYDIKVEWLQNGEWSLFQGFNSLSDDYATTNSREAASRAISLLAAEASSSLVSGY